MAIALDLSGKVALVTGGTRGVGLGITKSLLEAGAEVIAVARREAPALPDGARFVSVDVRDAAAVSALTAGLDRLDVVVNNAGGTPYVPVAETDPARHAKIIELNLTAPLIVARAANEIMQRGDGGAIIMISSISATRPSPGTAAYGAAKAGLESLAASLAVEWAPRVRVNAITVGMVRTERSRPHYGDEDGVVAVADTVPLGRLAEPRDVGDACVFLASDRAGYVSGSTLALHGGGERPAFLRAIGSPPP